MTNFVLVAGAWLGAWAWDDVVAPLREAGHGAYPLTLSGLAERRGEAAGQGTHVRDIVAEVESRDLREVVLVGHSYAGIPVGQAAQLIGDRLARVVFLDSDVPVDGESFASGWSEEGRAVLEKSFAAHDGRWAPSEEEFEGQGLTDEQVRRIVEGCTPHPGASLTEPARLTGPLGGLPATYVKCLLDGPEPPPAVVELLKNDGWRPVEMETGHWPMFSEPRALAALLDREASAG
ncbi:alpha/beta fold hydrolase [Streptomyces fuscigenes]|uniref:alpha/beta fold hydrolase n=1 Tax=Streptomyces fuscigenes TaxID=1528880 RepID=UPI001F17009D|nr:alpha/beta fold hydrolase [Streptomyces fuscigenes]MCF3964796.1 alpha/beta fold hydrolase [Streptomyces fuscigenes]